MTVQAIAGVTGAISFSGVGVGEGRGGGGPYWGAQLAVATSTNSEIMAGFDGKDSTAGMCRRWL